MSSVSAITPPAEVPITIISRFAIVEYLLAIGEENVSF
jgi:hypothetical protein